MRLKLIIKNRFAPRAGRAWPEPKLVWDIQVFLDLPNFTGGSSKFSLIAAPLTSMLKTSSIKSVEPRKGIIEVGGGGRNRVEPVSKHKVDEVDDGSGHSDDFDKKFHPRF